MRQLAHQDPVSLIGQETGHSILVYKIVSAEIGRRMQTQQEGRRLIKKTVIAIAATGNLNCYQGYHGNWVLPA